MIQQQAIALLVIMQILKSHHYSHDFMNKFVWDSLGIRFLFGTTQLLILISLTCINAAIIHFAEVRAHTSAAKKLNRDIISVHHYTIIDEMHNTR